MDKNICMAYAWLKIASDQNGAESKAASDDLQSSMTNSESKIAIDLYEELKGIIEKKPPDESGG